jgi:competence protein ComEC
MFPPDAVAILCDVGQGTALVIPLGGGAAIVDDVGPDPAKIDGCLRQAGITSIPLLILSHFHADHVDGLPGLTHGRDIGQVLVSPLSEPAEGLQFVRQSLGSRVRVIEPVSDGAEFSVAGATVAILSPSAVVSDVESPPNDNCVAVAITVHAQGSQRPVRILAPCDLEYAGQEQLLASHPGARGDFDVAVVPHHGSSKQLEQFAAWAHPKIALIPVGAHNDYGHPAPAAVELWERVSQSPVGRTDEQGNLVVRLCGDSVCLAH